MEFSHVSKFVNIGLKNRISINRFTQKLHNHSKMKTIKDE